MTNAVRFRNLGKAFPGVQALSDVSFSVSAGSVHAICGENGAGKSTLGRILAGIHAPDAGSIEIDGVPVRFGSPRDALAAGVAMVHQELELCDNLTVAENLCLGHLPRRFSFVDRHVLRQRATQLLQDAGCQLDPDRIMHSLSVAEQQHVQIAAAVGAGARIIVFDEPTSSLGEAESAHLFELIARLRARGVTIVYVSHRMPEIFRLCDDITVLRDGRHVSTTRATELDEAALVQRMIGRSLAEYLPAHQSVTGDVALDVKDLTSPGGFQDVSFTLRAGEVVGLAGLVGAGRSEIANALFGLDPDVRGEVCVAGQPARIDSARAAMACGIGLVPEDRKRQGLVLSMLAGENITLPTLERHARSGWVRRAAERATVARYFDTLRVAGRPDTMAAALSGGNQQKLVIAKWLAAESRILILDEPTRGVDVGAKAELHAWIGRLAGEGRAILLISSELPELLALSSRIIVLRSGRITGELRHTDASQELLLRMMTGLDVS
jgi:ABC-type sugar transport system ATPase subunit